MLLDAVRAAELVVFVGVMVQSVRAWRRRPSQATAWLTVTFALLTLIIAVGFLPPAPVPRPWPWELFVRTVVPLLLLIPYCLQRFTTGFRDVSPRVQSLTNAAAALMIAPVVLGPRLPGHNQPRPTWVVAYTMALLAYWTAMSVIAARRLWREGCGQPTVSRRRMQSLAAGSIILNVAVLVSTFTPRTADGRQLIVQLMVLASALLFHAGFVVPPLIRQLWRRPAIEALRRAESGLIAATTPNDVARAILPHAAELLGGGSAALLDADGMVIAAHGDADAAAFAGAVPNAATRAGTIVERAPDLVVLALREGWLVVQTSAKAPFLGREELDLVASLGHLLDLALDRANAFGELQERQRQLGEAQRVARIGSYEIDVETGASHYSDELYRILGLPIGSEVDEAARVALVHPDDRARVVRSQVAAFAGEPVDLEFRVTRTDGEVRWVHALGRSQREPGGGARLIGTIQDITEEKLVDDRLQHQALHDALTGLPNRVLLMDRVAQMLARRTRTGATPGVIFVDIDRFKAVNDSLGHAAGDDLLVAVAQRLVPLVRPGDTVARIGGDEFVIAVDDLVSPREAMQFAERVLKAVSQPLAIGGREADTTCSIGIALAMAGDSADTLVRDADMAMYRAKELGRSRIEVFDDALRREVVGRIDTEHQLRSALDGDELVLWFQPCLSLETGAVVSVEALVRWHHPKRGVLLPGEFVEIAENAGLVEALGARVLREACRIGAELRRALGGTAPMVWVNVSAHQLRRGGLGRLVTQALAESGLVASQLGIELTESAFMETADSVESELAALRSMGVHLALDDFGTGFSSMSYLRRFPFDLLKIDRSFVSGLGTDAEDTAIVSACVALAHSLGMPAVAEGVEDDAQRRALNLLGCDLVQGHLYSPPVPAAELLSVLHHIADVAGPIPARRPAKTVLVCDDEPSVRMLLRVGLEGAGAGVVEAGSAEHCVAAARRARPDLVLLDVSMPGAHDGLWALQELHASMPDLPVFIVTGSDDAGVSTRAAGLGAAGCIDKLGVLERLPEILSTKVAVAGALVG